MLSLALGSPAPGWAQQQQQQSIQLIRDTEIENTIRAYATPIFTAAGLDPTAVRIYLVNDRQINAFVAGGQNLFINSGLILQSRDAGQVIGVIAHEAGHIAGGHLARIHDAMANATAEMILAMVLGAAAAAASGNPAVGGAVMSGGQNIGVRNLLAYTRTQEASADAAAMRFLDDTHQSAKGLLSFFDTLSQQEALSTARQDPYLRTHPLTQERIEALGAFVAHSPNSNVPVKPEFEVQHRRMLAKLRAFMDNPTMTLRRYPETDRSLEARYARAIAYHMAADPPRSLASIDDLLREYPSDPYFNELKGQILLENGKPRDALPYYEKAVQLLPTSSLLRVDLARTQMATDDPQLVGAAVNNLRAAVAYEPNRPFFWRQYAIALGKSGQDGESALAMAEEALLLGKNSEARYHAGKAETLLPVGSPGWLKAQDIEAAAKQKQQQD